jgi:hypothetical protein
MPVHKEADIILAVEIGSYESYAPVPLRSRQSCKEAPWLFLNQPAVRVSVKIITENSSNSQNEP